MCVRETNINVGAIHGQSKAKALHLSVPKWVEARVVRNGESVLYVRYADVDSFLRLCRDSMLFQIKVLIDLCCIDYPFRHRRWTLVYILCSVHLTKSYCSEATLLKLTYTLWGIVGKATIPNVASQPYCTPS